MKEKVKTYKNHFFALFILMIIGFNACTPSKKGITILNSGTDSYTSLQISNPFGRAVTFIGNENVGAIGYELDGKTFWVKGYPEITVLVDSTLNYCWKQEERQVIMNVKEKEKETRFKFYLDSEKKPSAWHISLAASDGEYFTGIAERVVDGPQEESWKEGITTALNLRGERMEVKLKPTVSAYAPFYLSSENYAIFIHGTWPGVIDFCHKKPDRVQISFEGAQLSFSLMMDKSPADLVKRHALESGPSIIPPRWAFGPWRWRDEHINNKNYFDGSPVKTPYNSDVVEDILMMQAYDIPCTAYWIDRPWGPGPTGFDDYKIDEQRLPKFEEMIHWLNSKNIELMMWIAPFVMGEMADVAEERGYYLISKERENAHQVLIDFTNPEACKWWGENGPTKLAKMGIRGFKLDRGDGEKLLDSIQLVTSSGITYRENYNDYPRQYVKATYDAVKPVLGDNFILFPRAQYTGSSRYGTMWAGDTDNSQEGLRSVIIGMQRCAVMGYPLWCSDTGGYPKKLQREITQRWLGFSCFTPLMEVGPTNNHGFWGMNYEPSFDKELLATWRFYTKLRMSLVDYLYHYAKVSNKTAMPVARPLFLEYPKQKESWKEWTTYKLGDDLLVSPIWEKGKEQKLVYLPADETWIDLWNHKEYKGGKYIEVDAPTYKIPVFLKKGSSLQLPDLKSLYEESVKKTSIRYKMSDLEAKEGWK